MVKFMKQGIGIIFIIFLSLQISQGLTIGSDTGKILFEKVLRGGYASHPVIISTDSVDPLRVDPLILGEAKDWITIEPKNIALDKNNPANIKIIVQPPRDVANGNYSAEVSFLVSTTKKPETKIGSAVITSINIRITIEITGIEIKSCDASTFVIPDIEEGENPVARIKIRNTGNVIIKPSLRVELYNRDMTDVLYEGVLSTDTVTLPTEEQNYFYIIPITPTIGQYWAKLSIDECGASNLVSFDVVERGGISDKGELLRLDYKGSPFVGSILQIFAVFRNIGYREESASFEGAITKDGEIVKIIETPVIIVPPGKVGYIPFYFKPMEEGRYIVKGRVRYNNKLTYEKSMSIDVKQRESNNLLIFILIIIAALLLAFVLKKRYELRMRRRHW